MSEDVSSADVMTWAQCKTYLEQEWKVYDPQATGTAPLPNVKKNGTIKFVPDGDHIAVYSVSAGYVDQSKDDYPQYWVAERYDVFLSNNGKICKAFGFVHGDNSTIGNKRRLWDVELFIRKTPTGTPGDGEIRVTVGRTIPSGSWTGKDG
jgi:hypothetical protein